MNRIWLSALALLAGIILDPALVHADAREEALNWIDNYKQVQVLFHEKDIARLREEIAEGDLQNAAEWLRRTKPMRDALDSPQWAETRDWLKEFLRVQAIYSDEQIAEFRDEAKAAAKSSPEKFKEILAEVAKMRAKYAGNAAASERMREIALQTNKAYRQEEMNARLAAQRARAATTNIPKTAPPRRRQGPRYNAPVVDSLDAARWTIMRRLWRGW